MQCIEGLIKEVYNSSKIPFKLIVGGVGTYCSPMFNISEQYIRKTTEYRKVEYTIIVDKKYELAIDLLKCYFESNFKDIIIKKEDLLNRLLSEKDISTEVIDIVWPELNESFELINIYTDIYSNELYEEIKDIYSSDRIEVIYYENAILVVGNIENILDIVDNIKSRFNEYYKKSYITYCKINNYLSLKQTYDKTIYKLELAVKYEVKDIVFGEKELILEELVDSLSDEVKNKIREDFSSKITKLDEEMLKTIEVFFDCGLNLSEAAKELYIHRNTLIYRLDKIQRITSYDIRKFDNAMLFKIIYIYIGRKKLTVEKV